MIQRMLAIWFLVPLPYLNPAWTSGSSRFMYCWSLTWRILSITLLACEISAIVQYWYSLHLRGESCYWGVVVGNLISGSSAFSKSSLNIWKFLINILLKPGLENFEHYFTSMWDECNWMSILWHCLSLGLEWKLNFTTPVATAEFSKFADILSAAVSQHHLLGFEIAQLEFHHLH